MPHKNIEARREYYRAWCRRRGAAIRAYHRKWIKAHPESGRRWAEANREGQAVKKSERQRRYRMLHPEALAIHERRRRYRRRMEFIAAYGGRCSCCGEAEPGFLTVEHLYGDGGVHRRTLRGGKGGNTREVCQDLKRRGWPKDGYTVMCWNCNMARRFGRQCPHQDRPVEAIGVA